MKFLAMFLALTICSVSFAAPSASNIKAVIDYKMNGDTPVLYDYQLTSAVESNQPTDELRIVEADSKAVFWMKFMVPAKAKSPNITVVIKKGPVPVKTKEIVLKNSENGYYGYRTWVTKKYSKPGNYVVDVYHNDSVILSHKFSVK